MDDSLDWAIGNTAFRTYLVNLNSSLSRSEVVEYGTATAEHCDTELQTIRGDRVQRNYAMNLGN